MTDPIEAAAIVVMAIQFSFDQEEAKSAWSYVGQATQDKFLKRAESIIAAYRDSEIEALRAKLADCQDVIKHKGHDEDCPAASSACAICGLHELLHPSVTYFGDGQKHDFNRGPCSEACGHDRTTGEKA